MFTQRLSHHAAARIAGLISRLIRSGRLHDYAEQHGACEDSYTGRFGPLHLETNRCFVLDHQDAAISLRLPTLRGTLHLGYVVSLGEEQLRRPGGYVRWQKPRPKVICGQGQDNPDRPLPF